jgi:hypothetical protein
VTVLCISISAWMFANKFLKKMQKSFL